MYGCYEKMSDENIEIIHAPWNEVQIIQLNKYQHSNEVHPYTCVCQEVLVATKDGWFCPMCGKVVQTTALKDSVEIIWGN